MYANHPEMAKEWSEETDYSTLSESVPKKKKKQEKVAGLRVLSEFKLANVALPQNAATNRMRAFMPGGANSTPFSRARQNVLIGQPGGPPVAPGLQLPGLRSLNTTPLKRAFENQPPQQPQPAQPPQPTQPPQPVQPQQTNQPAQPPQPVQPQQPAQPPRAVQPTQQQQPGARPFNFLGGILGFADRAMGQAPGQGLASNLHRAVTSSDTGEKYNSWMAARPFLPPFLVEMVEKSQLQPHVEAYIKQIKGMGLPLLATLGKGIYSIYRAATLPNQALGRPMESTYDFASLSPKANTVNSNFGISDTGEMPGY